MLLADDVQLRSCKFRASLYPDSSDCIEFVGIMSQLVCAKCFCIFFVYVFEFKFKKVKILRVLHERDILVERESNEEKRGKRAKNLTWKNLHLDGDGNVFLSSLGNCTHGRSFKADIKFAGQLFSHSK